MANFLDALLTLAAVGNVSVQVGGAPIASRKNINFVSGATAADDPSHDRVNITIAGGGGSTTARVVDVPADVEDSGHVFYFDGDLTGLNDVAVGAMKIDPVTIVYATTSVANTYHFRTTGVSAGWLVFFDLEGNGGSVTVVVDHLVSGVWTPSPVCTFSAADNQRMRAIYFDGTSWYPLSVRLLNSDGSAGSAIPAPILFPGYAWLRGSDLVGADGTAIDLWANQSAPNQARGTGTARPTMQTSGGKRIARFDGVNDLMVFDATITADAISVYVVIRPTIPTGHNGIIFSTEDAFLYLAPDGTWQNGMNPAPLVGGTLVSGSIYLLEVHRTSAGDIDLVQNGALAHFSTGTSSWLPQPVSRLGADPDNTSALQADYHEVFACPLSSPAQRDYLREYFRTEHSIF